MLAVPGKADSLIVQDVVKRLFLPKRKAARMRNRGTAKPSSVIRVTRKGK